MVSSSCRKRTGDANALETLSTTGEKPQMPRALGSSVKRGVPTRDYVGAYGLDGRHSDHRKYPWSFTIKRHE